MIRRFLSRLLLLVLIAACGWNWLKVQQLSAQVTQLQAAQQLTQETIQRTLPPLTGAAAYARPLTPAARFGLPRLQAGWKHLRNQAILLPKAGGHTSESGQLFSVNQ